MDVLSDPRVFDGACRDLVELVPEYLEEALPLQVRAAVERHLVECPDCVEIVAQFRVIVAATGSLRRTAFRRRRSNGWWRHSGH